MARNMIVPIIPCHAKKGCSPPSQLGFTAQLLWLVSWESVEFARSLLWQTPPAVCRASVAICCFGKFRGDRMKSPSRLRAGQSTNPGKSDQHFTIDWVLSWKPKQLRHSLRGFLLCPCCRQDFLALTEKRCAYEKWSALMPQQPQASWTVNVIVVIQAAGREQLVFARSVNKICASVHSALIKIILCNLLYCGSRYKRLMCIFYSLIAISVKFFDYLHVDLSSCWKYCLLRQAPYRHPLTNAFCVWIFLHCK